MHYKNNNLHRFSFYIRKALSLINPLLIVTFLQIATNLIEIIVKGDLITKDAVLVTPNWFIIVYFFTEVFCYWLLKIRRVWLISIVVLILISISFVLNDYGYINQTIIASVFWLIGYLLFPVINQRKDSVFGGEGFVVLGLVAFLSTYNLPVGMYKNEYGNMALFFVTAFLGIFAMLDCSISLEKSMIIKCLGKYSIIVYSTHFFIRSLIIGIMRIITNNNNYTKYPYYMITFCTLVVSSIIVVYITNKWVPWLFKPTKINITNRVLNNRMNQM